MMSRMSSEFRGFSEFMDASDDIYRVSSSLSGVPSFSGRRHRALDELRTNLDDS
jgi:hypothetical protein